MKEDKKTIIDMAGNVQEFSGCMACAIKNGELKLFGGVLYEDEYFNVMQDLELPINGFIIIATKQHIEKFTELSNEAMVDLSNLIKRCLSILEGNHIAENYSLILEEKPNYHFHVWLMPRADWMLEKFGKVLKNIKPIQEYAVNNLKTPENLAEIAKTCKLLKEELNK